MGYNREADGFLITVHIPIPKCTTGWFLTLSSLILELNILQPADKFKPLLRYRMVFCARAHFLAGVSYEAVHSVNKKIIYYIQAAIQYKRFFK